MNKLKQNWKVILIVLLAFFSLNRCTVSCSRSSKINSQQKEIINKDSLINKQTDSINILNQKINGMTEAAVVRDKAMENIAAAKKNIVVNVKRVK